jgi:hypothetical protein
MGEAIHKARVRYSLEKGDTRATKRYGRVESGISSVDLQRVKDAMRTAETRTAKARKRKRK